MITRTQVERRPGQVVSDGRVTGTLTGQYDRDYDGRSWRWFAFIDQANGTRTGVWMGEASFVRPA